MHDSLLTTLIATDSGLASRIAGVITTARGATTLTRTESALLDGLDPGRLAPMVAGNITIFGKVRAALDAQPEGTASVAEAIETGVIDSDLEYVVLNELKFLLT